MRLLLIFLLYPMAVLAQTPDNLSWSPPGATWVYSEFSATTNRNLQIRYLNDTTMDGKTAKKMEVRRIEFLDVNLTVRTESLLGYGYFYQSNDSIFLWEDDAFRFIYDFSPAINDEWVVGTKKITCPTTYPEDDTITVDSIKQVIHGTRIFDYIYNNSSERKYVLGPVIRNIGPLTGPYPFVNRNICSQSSGLFQGLICYRDDMRREVPMPNSSGSFCHSVITSVAAPVESISKTATVYPNPVRNVVMLSYTSGEKVEYILYDAGGRMLARGFYTNEGIRVSHLKAGMYFLQTSGRTRRTEITKFIKL